MIASLASDARWSCNGVMAKTRWVLGLLGSCFVSLGAPACAPKSAAPTFELLSFDQAGEADVALNETLVFHFSDELERASVTDESLRITDEAGRPARGRVRVEQARLTFDPELPRLPDLSDAGLLPGRYYSVVLAGFPRPDGLRSQAGTSLARTVVLAFRTASRETPTGLFQSIPESRSRRPFLRLAHREIGPLEPVVLEYDGALDPTTVAAEDYLLIAPKDSRGSFSGLPDEGQSDPSALERDGIAFEVRLAENRSDYARLELQPLFEGGSYRALRPGSYSLVLAPSYGLSDLAGREIVMPPRFGRPPEVKVLAVGIGRETLDFEGVARRSGRSPGKAFDGTAFWSPDERAVTIRFPRAAGDGRDGRVELSLPTAPAELQATRLELPAGIEVDLSGHEGPVVLRAQGAIEIAGRLRRRLARPFSFDLPSEAARAGSQEDGTEPDPLWFELQRARGGSWGTLSDWLERVSASEEPWTVLIAGGDLRVSGEVDIEGPLLLIAGGWIRIDGGPVRADLIFKSPDGGENVQARGPDPAENAPLVIDAPEVNPLAEPLEVAVFSQLVRPPGGVSSWRPAGVVGDARGGSFRVEYVGQRDLGTRFQDYGPIDDLTLLEDCAAIRLLVRLSLPAGNGEAWMPPRVERVELSWNEPSPSRE